MPFFAERRLIVVENSGFFKNATPELADYIKTMPDTACFIFVENEVDKRNRLYKAVKDKGRVVELGRQDEKTLLYWIGAQVKREGKLIKTSTAQYLVEKTGTDMENLEKNWKSCLRIHWMKRRLHRLPLMKSAPRRFPIRFLKW